MATRRTFIHATVAAAAAAGVPWRHFIAAAYGGQFAALADPAIQPKFVNRAPNALDPAFKYVPDSTGQYNVAIRAKKDHYTGLVDPKDKKLLATPILGYGDSRGPTWPGRTFEVQSSLAGGNPITRVRWANELKNEKHPLPVDTSVHWCYSLFGEASANGVDYRQFSIDKDGIPIITHLHGGHTDFQYDGNPEFFYSPDALVTGPQWDAVTGGFTDVFQYDNGVPAGNLWYHDHALGLTRLNVYAGLAGFYFVRDALDTGKGDNPLGLPAYPYELAYAIQDRMFTDKGELFYPAFPGDPFYSDYITDEEAELPPDLFKHGGPSALAEFFGDHMLVNGLIWPKADVEPRVYRIHLLNGTDSRFMVIQFAVVPAGETDFQNASAPLPFLVIGSDQGLTTTALLKNTLVLEPGGRYDLLVDFTGLEGKRVIVKNIGGDFPFGGMIPGAKMFAFTDRIMAFDVADVWPTLQNTFNPANFGGVAQVQTSSLNENLTAGVRKVALFEGHDEFGRLQPLLGVVNEDGTATPHTWFQTPTETPTLGTTEQWDIYNFTGDAHPIHLHLVHFQTVGRREISWTAGPDVSVPEANGTTGTVDAVSHIVVGQEPPFGGPGSPYVETARKDMVTALPGQRTSIVATFDKPGRYVWHCHILSHEDHEMMRPLVVG